VSESNDDKRQAMFARLTPLLGEHAPTDSVMALGHLMRQWLRDVIADAGTSVDTGAGCGGYDLWVKMGGEEVYIHLKPSLATPYNGSPGDPSQVPSDV
jgi:hypothetical protein